MAQRIWTKEQLANLREIEAWPTLGVNIKLLPMRKGGLVGAMGEGLATQLTWTAWLFTKRVIGPAPVSVEELEAAGLAPEEARSWVERTRHAVTTLNKLYPTLVPAIEASVKAIEAAIPEALPVPEVKEEEA